MKLLQPMCPMGPMRPILLGLIWLMPMRAMMVSLTSAERRLHHIFSSLQLFAFSQNLCWSEPACGCRFVIKETFVLICRQLGGTAHLIFIGNGRINQLKEFQGFVKYQLTVASLLWRSMLILASWFVLLKLRAQMQTMRRHGVKLSVLKVLGLGHLHSRDWTQHDNPPNGQIVEKG